MLVQHRGVFKKHLIRCLYNWLLWNWHPFCMRKICVIVTHWAMCLHYILANLTHMCSTSASSVTTTTLYPQACMSKLICSRVSSKESLCFRSISFIHILMWYGSFLDRKGILFALKLVCIQSHGIVYYSFVVLACSKLHELFTYWSVCICVSQSITFLTS